MTNPIVTTSTLQPPAYFIFLQEPPTIVQQTRPYQAAPQNMALYHRPTSPILSLDVSSVIPINRARIEPTGTVVTVSGRPSLLAEGRWLLGDGTAYIECGGDLDLGAGLDWRIVRARVLDRSQRIRLQIIDSRGK